MAESTTEARPASSFLMLTLMAIVILAVWSISLVGTVMLYRNAITTLQSVTAMPDLPDDPKSGAQLPLPLPAE